MNSANCLALSEVETRLAVHLTGKKQETSFDNKIQKRNVRTTERLIDKLKNPETKEFNILKLILKPISKFGQISDITSLSLICFMLFSSFCAKAEGSINDVQKYNKVLELIFKYAAISGGITLPFIVVDTIQDEISENHKWTKEKEKIRLEKEQLESKTLRQTLSLVKSLQNNSQDFKFNFARSLINNTDISENTIEYNEKLLILLSKIIEDETKENLEELAEHLDKERRVNQDNASSQFLDNTVVKQLVKSYSKKRS